MKTDTEIKVEGTKALIKAMGTVEAERYIALMAREKFDYTKWRKTMLPEGSIQEISKAAMQYTEKTRKSKQ
ncbi:MAG: hypothetical protein QMD01_01485 [Thermodesulfovibrionales bacterium]|nr:hypothetical protein [Thermodesulfovibrionales bacterium]